jgi:hypothetical protein
MIRLNREKNQRDEERERLSKIHIITSVEELKSLLLEIEEESISTAKKSQKKRALVKEQIKIRNKVNHEKIDIPFTAKGKQRSLSDFIRDYSSYLQSLSDNDVIDNDVIENVAIHNTHSYISYALVE